MRNPWPLIPKVLIMLLLLGGFRTSAQVWDKPYPGNEPGVLYYPDQYASYFRYGWKNDGSQVLVIKGKLPKARYFSFNLYDDMTKGSLLALADHQIRTEANGDYTIHIVTSRNHTPYPNRMVVPDSVAFPSVFLRYYVAEGDIYASVPLPSVFVEANGSLMPAPKSIPMPPGGASQASALRNILKADPQRLTRKERKELGSEKTPASRKEELVCKVMTAPVFRHYKDPGHISAYNFQSDGNYPNKDNHYIVMPVQRKKGQTLLVRFRPPSYTTVLGDVSKEVRYFSVSQGDEFTRTSLTLHDTQLSVADDGFVYIAVTKDTVDLQAVKLNAKINVMPWYHDKQMVLILRHMLPAPYFANSTDHVPLFNNSRPAAEQASEKFIGDHALTGVYVKTSSLANGGNAANHFEPTKSKEK